MNHNAASPPPWLFLIAQALSPQPVYLVGGAVRNTLMGLPVADYDVCGPLRPQEVLAACEGTAVHAHLRAAHFGTVELHAQDASGRHMAEYTTFREDSYRGGHSPSAVRFAQDISTDALRRDFSVNALYRRILPQGLGEVIDPTGGLADLAARRLHTVTPDPYQVMKDDGLRLLRLVRFACEFGLAPSPELMVCAKAQGGLLREIVPERLKEEMTKILLSDQRYPHLPRPQAPVAMGLELLEALGFFPYLLPHCQVRTAACARYALLSDSLPGRLAALVMDAWPEEAFLDLMRLRFPSWIVKETHRLLCLWQDYPRWKRLPWEACRAGAQGTAHIAHCLSAAGHEAAGEKLLALWEEMSRKGLPLSLKELAVNGHDLTALGFPPTEIGQGLDALWRMAVTEQCPNEKDALLCRAAQLLKEE